MKIKLFGTKIYISFLFTASVSLMLATDRTGLIIPTLFAALIHESGHLMAMWAADCAPREIRLIPASVQIVEGFKHTAKAGVWMVLCGPLANAAVSATLFINYYLGASASLNFALLNAVLAVFNMLPVSGLDGGRILSLLICRRKDLYTAEKAVSIITAVLAAAALIFGICLLLRGRANVSVFIVALYFAVLVIMKR